MEAIKEYLEKLKRFSFDENGGTFVGLTTNRQMIGVVRGLLTELLRALQASEASQTIRQKCVEVYGHVDLVFSYYENRHIMADSIRHLTPQLINAELRSLIKVCDGLLKEGVQENA